MSAATPSHAHAHAPTKPQLRSQRYAEIADALAQTCSARINDDGSQIGSNEHGALWNGTIFYCAGEMVRVRGANPEDICNKNYVAIISQLLTNSPGDNVLVHCFAAMGLAMLGPAESNPALLALSENQRKKVFDTLQVTQSYDNNWEAFNACLRIGRCVLYGDDPEAVIPHLNKIADKYLNGGYFDDSKDSGVYNNYGLMSLNFALRVSEFLDRKHPVRNHLEECFRPHAMRYFKLLQDFIHHNGQGWVFGRSAGCLGQLQCLVFLEQILSKGWLDSVQESWCRRACSKLLDYMCDIFWDMEHNWFSFRDNNRSCYAYRKTLPMTWDLWRYFLQLQDYAQIDEQRNPQQETDDSMNTAAICSEVISSEDRKTAYLTWGDGNDRILLPIMGGPGWVSGDTMPRPFCPGLFEWVTDSHCPVLCPRLTINNSHYWPAWWPSATQLINDGDCATYTVSYDKLVNDDGQAADFPITWHCTYIFASGHFERRDVFNLQTDLHCSEIRMEILQGQKHPKAINYPPVRQLSVRGNSSINGLTLSDSEDINDDPSYVNYYAHASKRWVFNGENIALNAGDHEITTIIDW